MEKLAMGYRAETEESTPQMLRVFIVRHGEPTQYGVTDAPLTDRGLEQMNSVADHITEALRQQDGKSTFLKILYSGRRRTHQSAQVIDFGIRNNVREQKISKVHLLPPMKDDVLQTADALDTLIKNQIPVEIAYYTWLTADKKYLKSIGSPTPEQLRSQLLNRVMGVKESASQMKNTDFFLVQITHETSFGAILGEYTEQKHVPTQYGEISEVTIPMLKGNTPQSYTPAIFRYRDTIYTDKLPAE